MCVKSLLLLLFTAASTGVTSLLLLLLCTVANSATIYHSPQDKHASARTMAGVLDDVLSPEHHPRCSVFFIIDAASSDPSTIALMKVLRVPGGVGVFTAAADVLDGNVTLQQLPQVLSLARKLRQVSWCVTVVVVSDDLTFLATFAQWSLKGRLLVWSTRLLVVTRLPLHHLHHLHTLLSNTNSMLIIYEESLDSIRCGVYLQVPYSPQGAQALKVASWTPQRGLALTSSLPLFPDKFSR
ncbi:uncharacterized protein [Procambarus clarkii]|uniref:uncharacterized protein n=1 Tax=Procambarus clarkii TaxID=6728 RepID=UPI0037443B20